MHPILIHLGPITVRTYGALVAVAFLVSLRVATWAAHRRRLSENFLLDLAAVLVVSGLAGARLFYVILNAGYYRQHPWETLKIWEGGLVFYGGFLLAAAAGVFFVRRRKVSLGVAADCVAPALALGQAVGRLGCFFAGCCYGRPTAVPWSVQFNHPASLAPLGIDMHPVQIYEALGNVLIGAFLWLRLEQRPQSRGEVFWLYVLLYGILRFAVETLRGDDRGPALGGLYPSQVIALLAVLVSGSILIAQLASPSGVSHGTVTKN